jgi:hypothetical protein
MLVPRWFWALTNLGLGPGALDRTQAALAEILGPEAALSVFRRTPSGSGRNSTSEGQKVMAKRQDEPLSDS